MGGERCIATGLRVSDVGSPPRGRGKVRGVLQFFQPTRITPAWAGKRNWAIGSRLLNWDHPRTGGEKGSYRWVIKSVKGSPPHKRGKVDVLFGGLVDGRITPAQAGKSWEEWRLRFR